MPVPRLAPKEFAAKVMRTAREVPPEGWFGDRKVFIHRAYEEMSGYLQTYEVFKEQLLDAHQKGLISLSRADMVEMMDERDVDESRVYVMAPDGYVIAQYNFIVMDTPE